MNHYKNLFLQQSYNDNTDLFYDLLARDREDRSSVQNSGMYWDYVILTAANDMQAASYQEQISVRLTNHRLVSATHYAVLSDPCGKRVGSGGATFNVLRYLSKHAEKSIKSLKILLIHSGGDAKRTPQYSACGKIFSPVPRMLPDGNRSTLFDEFMIAMCGIPARISSGLLTCSGDVELLFNPLQLDFYGEGAAAFSMKESAETGKNHGVFFSKDGTYVSKFFHKQTVDSLRRNGAIDGHGLVNIDTGAVLFSGQMVEDLYSLVDTKDKFASLVNDHIRLSFYADFLYPLAQDSALDLFYKEQPEGEFSPELKFARKLLWDTLRKYRLKLVHFSPASFLHFGTTYEVRKLVTEDIAYYKYFGWSNVVNSNYRGRNFACSNAYVSIGAKVGDDSYIEDSYIHNNVRTGKGCVISGVTLGHYSGNIEAAAYDAVSSSEEKDICIPDDTVIHGLKLRDDRFVVRAYGVKDNPKESKWFGREIDMPLWNRRLFVPCETIQEAVQNTLSLVDAFLRDGNIPKDDGVDRVSLESSFNAANLVQIIPWQEKLNDKIKLESLMEAIDNHISVEESVSIFRTGISERLEKWFLQAAECTGFERKMRIYYYLSKIPSVTNAEELADRCFDTLRDTILDWALQNTGCCRNLHIARDEVITRLPVRVNWGGGWSDTPPYCMEHGGTVLNAAVQLNGEDPIEVTIRKIPEFKIVLESTDIGSYGEFTDILELQDCRNPSDPFALHKAALIACGIIPFSSFERRPSNNSVQNLMVEEICSRIGGGIYINTRVINIPKGSGLGTSSILAGACVKGLFEFFDVSVDDNELYNTVLCMEQIMSTGGGWQDQVGGLTPGIKMVTADSGLAQNIVCTPLRIRPEVLRELNERFALIYTGQRRLARNLLRDIVGKYIGNDPDTVDVLYRIQQLAVLMRLELEKGHIDGFAKLLNEHWELSKKLDNGCTNTCIDQIFNSVNDLIDGKMICGAGGGGFIQVILKKGVTKEELQERLNGIFGESGVGVWECKI